MRKPSSSPVTVAAYARTIKEAARSKQAIRTRVALIAAERGLPKSETAFAGRMATGYRWMPGGLRALKDYDEVIRLTPTNHGAFNNRGNVYMSKRQYDRALKDYDEAVRLNPTDGLLVRNRANALRIIGQYDRAIAEFRKALTLNVGDAMKRQIETALKELGAAG